MLESGEKGTLLHCWWECKLIQPLWRTAWRFLKKNTRTKTIIQFRSVVSNCLWPHGLQHASLPCPSPTPGAYSNSCPSSQWCFQSSRPLSSPFPPTFNLSQHQGLFKWVIFFTSHSQSIGVSASASVLPMNIQDLFPLGWTRRISLRSKGFSRVFSNTTVQKLQFFSAQLSSQSNSHIHTWPQEKP